MYFRRKLRINMCMILCVRVWFFFFVMVLGKYFAITLNFEIKNSFDAYRHMLFVCVNWLNYVVTNCDFFSSISCLHNYLVFLFFIFVCGDLMIIISLIWCAYYDDDIWFNIIFSFFLSFTYEYKLNHCQSNKRTFYHPLFCSANALNAN